MKCSSHRLGANNSITDRIERIVKMKTLKNIGMLALVAIGMPLLLWRKTRKFQKFPPTPAAIDEVVYARSFELDQGYKFEWRKEQPLVKKGVILVLKVDPDLVYPRQIAEPVLYVGDQTAERVNIGYKSGHVVAIVPGEVDLNKAMIWFGYARVAGTLHGQNDPGRAQDGRTGRDQTEGQVRG